MISNFNVRTFFFKLYGRGLQFWKIKQVVEVLILIYDFKCILKILACEIS